MCNAMVTCVFDLFCYLQICHWIYSATLALRMWDLIEGFYLSTKECHISFFRGNHSHVGTKLCLPKAFVMMVGSILVQQIAKLFMVILYFGKCGALTAVNWQGNHLFVLKQNGFSSWQPIALSFAKLDLVFFSEHNHTILYEFLEHFFFLAFLTSFILIWICLRVCSIHKSTQKRATLSCMEHNSTGPEWLEGAGRMTKKVKWNSIWVMQ